jgi:hypothetical protein
VPQWTKWILIAFGVVAGVAFLGVALWTYAGHDRVELIDDPDVAAAMSQACDAMRSDLAAISGATRATERVAAENAAALRMIGLVRAVGDDKLNDDRPAKAWLGDWERLVAARRAGLGTPTTDGEPITRRMTDLAADSGIRRCEVPSAFLAGRAVAP